MTDSPTLASLAATLAEVSQQLEAIRGESERHTEPELDPDDPLNEILPDLVSGQDTTFGLDFRADSYLKLNIQPRTIRNLLLAYARLHPHGYSFSIDSQKGDGVYRIYRVMQCRAESPEGDIRNTRSTSGFPIPTGKPASELVGWNLRFLNREFKVLDTCEIDGRSYLFTES